MIYGLAIALGLRAYRHQRSLSSGEEPPAPGPTVPSETILPEPAVPETAPSVSGVPLPRGHSVALERFRRLTANAFTELPRIAELKALSDEELHSRPLPLQRAGAVLGRVAQELKTHTGQSDRPESQEFPGFKEFNEEALRFYLECSSADEIVQPVRALCFRNFTMRGGVDPGEKVPDAIKKLAKEIP